MLRPMIHKDEIAALEQRAHAARITMPQLCDRAGKYKQSWYRARANGKAAYSLFVPLEKAMDEIEREREQ